LNSPNPLKPRLKWKLVFGESRYAQLANLGRVTP
jgi:hypothetical protein